MPGQDQTIPLDYGRRTGRGAGFCAGNSQLDTVSPMTAPGWGPGSNCSPGFGGGMGRGQRARRRGFFTPMSPFDEKSRLDEQREALMNRLEMINQKLDELKTMESQEN